MRTDFLGIQPYNPNQADTAILAATPPTADQVAAREAPTQWQNLGLDLVDADGHDVPSIFIAVHTCGIPLEDRKLPKPRFPNWLLRYLRVLDDEDKDLALPVQTDLVSHPVDLDFKAALYSACLGSSSTTVHCDWNLTGREFAVLLSGAPDAPPTLMSWAQQLDGYDVVNWSKDAGSSYGATIVNTARHIYNCDFSDSVFMCESLIGRQDVITARCANAYTAFKWPHAIPDIGSCLSTLSIVARLPLEFGLTCGSPRVSFVNEVSFDGGELGNSYAAREGVPKDWERKTSGDDAAELIPYGLLALNVIAQLNRGHGREDIAVHEDFRVVDPRTKPSVSSIQRRELLHGMMFHPGIHDTNIVKLPALLMASLDHGVLERLKTIDYKVNNVGVILRGLGSARPMSNIVATASRMNKFSAGGRTDRRSNNRVGTRALPGVDGDLYVADPSNQENHPTRMSLPSTSVFTLSKNPDATEPVQGAMDQARRKRHAGKGPAKYEDSKATTPVEQFQDGDAPSK